MRVASCHPDRKFYGHGLCRRCYMKEWNAAHPRPYDQTYAANYYRAHKCHLVAAQSARRKANGVRNKSYILDYLTTHHCVDCGESDPVVLEFDHVRGTKLWDISKTVRDMTPNMLTDELAKCDVRCANCHRRKTAKERSYYRLMPREDTQLHNPGCGQGGNHNA